MHILVRSLKINHGLRIRVTMGAILSVLDITSDIYMTIVFLSSEDDNQHKFGYVTLGMIGVFVFLQLFMVIVQYAKFSLSRKLLEMFYVVTFLRPAVDAHRVGQAKSKGDHQMAFSPIMELQCNKLIETVAEAIPGAIIQTYALLVNDFDSKAAMGSVLLSALTTAFVNTTVCHDMDTNPKSRKNYPEFYGYFGDTQAKRSKMFLLLCCSSCLMVVVKSITFAMMMKTKASILYLYLLADFCLFFFVKAARKDLWYASINVTGLTAVGVSFMFRLTMKLNTDFMVLLQARHPLEVRSETGMESIDVKCTNSSLRSGDGRALVDLQHVCQPDRFDHRCLFRLRRFPILLCRSGNDLLRFFRRNFPQHRSSLFGHFHHHDLRA